MGLTNIAAIAASDHFAVALKTDGTVTSWGYPVPNGELNIPTGLNDVIQVAAGEYHSLALKADGTVVGWGYNGGGQASPPPDLTDVVQITAGWGSSFALKGDGTVVAWGGNTYGALRPPADLNNVIALAAGSYHTLALKSDGTVVGWGNNDYAQITIPSGLSGVTTIAAGAFHCVALASGGAVTAWGSNLGDNKATTNQSVVPSGLTGAVAVTAGFYHSAVLTTSNAVVPVLIAVKPGGVDTSLVRIDVSGKPSAFGSNFFYAQYGSTFTVTLTPPAFSYPNSFRFVGTWDDASGSGVPLTRTITATAPSTYQGSFSVQSYVTVNILPDPSYGRASLASGWYDSATFVSVLATPNPGFAFSNFTSRNLGYPTTANPYSLYLYAGLTTSLPLILNVNFARQSDGSAH